MSAPVFATSENINQARAALDAEGYLLLHAFDESYCGEIRALMDAHQQDQRTEIRYAGTELRIWDAERRHPRYAEFHSECNAFASSLMDRPTEAFTLLAIRNRALAPEDVKERRGRWHIDSFRKQLKIFLFLSDTTEASGPFEFIPRTHSGLFKMKAILGGRYIQPSDIAKGSRAYSRLDDSWIDGLAARGYQPKAVLCPAGTVMVIDTSAVHRARPCIEGARYALTAYF